LVAGAPSPGSFGAPLQLVDSLLDGQHSRVSFLIAAMMRLDCLMDIRDLSLHVIEGGADVSEVIFEP